MKVNRYSQTIELTRRNLNTLLTKLDGVPGDSACTISKDGWLIRAVEDLEHYSDRPAGAMHPETEEKLPKTDQYRVMDADDYDPYDNLFLYVEPANDD